MAEDEANLIERDVMPQHLCGCCMAQQVSAFGRSLYGRTAQGVFDHS
jgi:hypothetical protein